MIHYLQRLIFCEVDSCGFGFEVVKAKGKLSRKGYPDCIESIVGKEVQELLELVGPQPMQKLDVTFISKPVGTCNYKI